VTPIPTPAFALFERPEVEDELEVPAGFVEEEPGTVAAAVAAASADDTDRILSMMEMTTLAALVTAARLRLVVDVVGNTSVFTFAEFPATLDEDVTVAGLPDTAVECSVTVVAAATLTFVGVVDVLYAPGSAR
jgi:hypothetical protein